MVRLEEDFDSLPQRSAAVSLSLWEEKLGEWLKETPLPPVQAAPHRDRLAELGLRPVRCERRVRYVEVCD